MRSLLRNHRQKQDPESYVIDDMIEITVLPSTPVSESDSDDLHDEPMEDEENAVSPEQSEQEKNTVLLIEWKGSHNVDVYVDTIINIIYQCDLSSNILNVCTMSPYC